MLKDKIISGVVGLGVLIFVSVVTFGMFKIASLQSDINKKNETIFKIQNECAVYKDSLSRCKDIEIVNTYYNYNADKIKQTIKK